jgi:hypothetical protein
MCPLPKWCAFFKTLVTPKYRRFLLKNLRFLRKRHAFFKTVHFCKRWRFVGKNLQKVNICTVAGENVQVTWNHPPTNLPTCFYKYVCIIPYTKSAPTFRGINILFLTVLLKKLWLLSKKNGALFLKTMTLIRK